MLIFFFQAEDGIRDTSVTGVQTCALPIWPGSEESSSRCRPTLSAGFARARATALEIGRASCRERVESSVVGVAVKKKRRELPPREPDLRLAAAPAHRTARCRVR